MGMMAKMGVDYVMNMKDDLIMVGLAFSTNVTCLKMNKVK